MNKLKMGDVIYIPQSHFKNCKPEFIKAYKEIGKINYNCGIIYNGNRYSLTRWIFNGKVFKHRLIDLEIYKAFNEI